MANENEFDLEKIAEEWAKDAVINELDIVKEIGRVPILHAKYLQRLTTAKLKLQRFKVKYHKLRQLKFRYYRGELSKEELTTYGWEQWQGMKPLKSEMNEFLQGDVDLVQIEEKMEFVEAIISTYESILKSINQRGWDLRTMLQAKQFYSGGN
jgi:hypothetical protein